MAREVTFPKTRHVALSGLEQGAEAKSAGSETILLSLPGARVGRGHVLTPATIRNPLPAFFFNDTATTEIYTLSLHDALPISRRYLPLRSRDRAIVPC